eukprot:TRINITY_DN2659_c0_g1_i1.p1 TRINITY_DN2659_c0_g1~~TRINITY_DN2659_c0_g1_i1.p1  ORF type:complete len:317 (+),score=64.17 TRINITY_DN2659_c0_g1_i1:76-951(+)
MSPSALLLALLAFGLPACSAWNVRFVNAVNSTLTLNTTTLGVHTLDYQEVTPYLSVPSGVDVESVMTALGEELLVNGSQRINGTGSGYFTVSLSIVRDTFFLVMFAEPVGLGKGNTTYIRFLHLADSPRYVSLYFDDEEVEAASFIGPLEQSNYVEVPDNVTISAATSATSAGAFPIMLPEGITDGNVYTVFFYGTQGIANLDRVAPQFVTTNAQMPASTQSLTTGMQVSTSGEAATSTGASTAGNEATSTSGNSGNSPTPTQDSQENEDSAGSVIRFASVVAAAAAILAF